MKYPQATRNTQLKNDTFGLVSRLLQRDFVKYRKPLWLTVINETIKFWYGGEQNGPPTSFSPVTSTNIGISPKNVLTFIFDPFATLV